ncbi:hypothetical protein BJV38_003958 [Clostridium beijerinckii]|nr:hypothetical protein [Clostridium beijerinckii]NRT47115.1 hypothetical protein [Clostridium beijerinckii]NRZ18881.1 hypothetical protein [Clostridium beijerinckii]CUU46384.1 protein of unknown function [Clostridium beijerinckii]
MLPALSFSYLYCIKFFIKINIYLKLFKLGYGIMSITKGSDSCKETPRTSSELNNYLVQFFV